MYPASRILWRRAGSEYLWVLLAKHDGQAVRMWPSAPKTISSWISQAQRGHQGIHRSKKDLWVQVQTTFCAPKPFVPITLAHPSFTPWWQELHDHIFNVPVHPLYLELMPDFQPTSEVICSSPFITSVFNHTPHWSWFCHSAGYSTCPTCQDNPL
jgi:hypothetical protein